MLCDNNTKKTIQTKPKGPFTQELHQRQKIDARNRLRSKALFTLKYLHQNSKMGSVATKNFVHT